MISTKKYITAFSLIIFISLPMVCMAQAEIEEARSSLRGLPGVGFTVDVEQNTAFADTQLVKIQSIRELAHKELEAGDIRIYSDQQVMESIRTPVLYLHLNILSTRTGIISFGITASVYQPVELVLDGGREITASTWETSMVGIASYDKIGVINQAVSGVIQHFIDDYHKVNSN